MSIWTEPSPSDFDRWEERIFHGEEPSLAARELGFTCTRFKRADPQRHHEALEAAREIQAGEDREYVRRRLRDNVEMALTPTPKLYKGEPVPGVYEFDGDVANRGLELLAKIGGAIGDQRVEVTGAGGGPVVIEDRSASLADVARVLEAAGALAALGRESAGGEVPAARRVLAAPRDG